MSGRLRALPLWGAVLWACAAHGDTEATDRSSAAGEPPGATGDEVRGGHGDDGDTGYADPSRWVAMELGGGEAGFSPLEPGAALSLHPGPQGCCHVYAGVRFRDADGRVVRGPDTFLLHLTRDGVHVAGSEAARDWSRAWDGAAYSGVALVFLAPSPELDSAALAATYALRAQAGDVEAAVSVRVTAPPGGRASMR